MIRILLLAGLACASLCANADSYLIEHVRIFNGVDAELTPGHVLVEDGIITKVSNYPIDSSEDTVIIDGGNRVLSPGFANVAKRYLNSGFTTIRDAGGTHPHLARAINSGTVYGPRVYPSGAVLSQTGGHGDRRHADDSHPSLQAGDPYMAADRAVLVDGVDQHLMAARENLRHGATQIKIMGGGGVMSDYDPIHSLQPSPAEIRAAVQAATDWGTYVLAHAYTSEAVRRLVDNGVRCIEHALLIDDATAKYVKQNDIVISTQLVVYRALKDLPGITANNLEKLDVVLKGQENLIRLIKKYDITTGFSTDLIGGMYPMMTREFTERALYWTPAEVLTQATSESAKVIRMAGRLNRHGNFGEIREGWVADLVLIDGEPLEDISVLRDPDSNLALIMLAGKIVKNDL